MNKIQLTLALIKPDAAANPVVVKGIEKIIADNKFHVIHRKKFQVSRSKAEKFYAEHQGKFFYNRLVSTLSSGPLWAFVLARKDAIKTWRSLMGPTKVYKTVYEKPESIRGRFGLTDTRNCTHGSDSEETARREISFFFPEFKIDEWLSSKENLFQRNNL